MITSSILNSITFKNITSGSPNMWNTLHINRSQGNSKIIPYYQKFDKDHVVYLQFSSDSPYSITLKSYQEGRGAEIESVTNSFDSVYGTTDVRYFTNFVIVLDSAYYDKKVYFTATHGSDVLTSEPVYVYDLAPEIEKGIIKHIKYTNLDRIESDLDDRFIDWSVLASEGNYMDFFIDAIDIDPNDTDENEVLDGSQSKTIISSVFYSGRVLKTGGVPDYMASRMAMASSVDIFTVNDIQYIKSGEASQDRYGSSTLYQVSLKLTQKNALGINVDRLDLVAGMITSQTNCSAYGQSDGSVTVEGSAGSPPYEYSIGGAYGSSGIFSGLAAGNYTVVIRDANSITCNIPVTITQPSISTLDGPDVLDATNVSVIGFTANWTALSIATGYYLDVATDSEFTSMVAGYSNLPVGNVISYPVASLDGRVHYYYRLRAIVGGYVSQSSNTITVSPVLDRPVTRYAAGLTNTSFYASWDNGVANTGVLGATGYRLDVATDVNFTSMVSGFDDLDVENVLTYEVTGLTLGASYYYRVRAYNAFQTSANSPIMSQTQTTPPSIPVATGATDIADDSFVANWQISAGAASYILQVSDLFDFSTFIFNENIGDFDHYTVPGLTEESLYFYRVQACNADPIPIASGYSLVIPVRTLMSPIEALPANNYFSQGFTANWKPKPSAIEYFLTIATDSAFTSIVSGFNDISVGNVVTYDVTGLTANTNYWYRIKGYNGVVYSEYSNAILQSTSQAPNAPVAIDPTFRMSSQMQANWYASTNCDGYNLDVATDVGFSSKVSGYDNKIVYGLNDIISGLTASTAYYYRIRSFKGSIYSAYSNIITTASLGLVPDPPTATAVTNIGTDGFTANWDASTGATGYKLYISQNPICESGFESGYNGLDIGNVVTYDVTGLIPGHGYFYRVAAYNGVGDGSMGNIITAYTNTLPLPTIVITPAVWNFPGINANKIITVTVTNATSWSIDFPSLNGRIHEYSRDANSATLYYDGAASTGDSVNFHATGPGGTVTTQFTGTRI